MSDPHPDHNITARGFKSQSQWDAMSTNDRIGYLRHQDRIPVAGMLAEAQRQARADVLAASLRDHDDLRDRTLYDAWLHAKSAAIQQTERDLWAALAAGAHDGRCAHGASADYCHVRDCAHMKSPAPRGTRGVTPYGEGRGPVTDNWRDDIRRR